MSILTIRRAEIHRRRVSSPFVRRPTLIVTSLALGALLLALSPVTAASAASPRLPDLGMAPLGDFVVDRSSGARLLRFTTEIVNVGAGPFIVSGRRSSPSGVMTVRQRLNYDDGSVGTLRTQAVMEYSGDGHDHWHVRDLERYSLHRVGSTREVGRGAKVGFCFLDSHIYRASLPGVPPSPVYSGCGSQASTAVDMGLSVGWGDVYPWYLAFQWIDISGLPNGDYVIKAQADPHAVFTETSTANNATWTRVRISANDQVTVLEQGPVA
jgi:hypothetical protein